VGGGAAAKVGTATRLLNVNMEEVLGAEMGAEWEEWEEGVGAEMGAEVEEGVYEAKGAEMPVALGATVVAVEVVLPEIQEGVGAEMGGAMQAKDAVVQEEIAGTLEVVLPVSLPCLA